MHYVFGLLFFLLMHQFQLWVYAIDGLAAVLAVSSAFLYWLQAKQLSGQINLQITTDEHYDPMFAFARKIAELLSIVVLIQFGQGYEIVGYLALPIFAMTLWAEMFAMLIYFEIIELVESEDYDEDDEL